MDETCCPFYYWMDMVLFITHDFDFPEIADELYYRTFECGGGGV